MAISEVKHVAFHYGLIIGVGTATRFSAVRWGRCQDTCAWLLTISGTHNRGFDLASVVSSVTACEIGVQGRNRADLNCRQRHDEVHLRRHRG